MSAVFQQKIDGTGPSAVEVLAVEGIGGTESASWQTVENVLEKTSLHKECGSTFSVKKSESEKVSKGCSEKEEQEGIQGQWQHCASRRTRRCHPVVVVPTLQQFSFGGLHLVGTYRKEALQLVVRNLWIKI